MQASGKQTILKIYVQPNATKSEVIGLYGEPARLKIKIKALPVDGAANTEVIAFISKVLGLSKSQVEFVRGESSRQKDLLIDMSIEKLRSHFIF
ncbi:MAG: DUF167 domain-containing protein [Bdellovibrionales bacterium]|nr:DUF167 domain-containing protein [Bdellovibrionales bacterium]